MIKNIEINQHIIDPGAQLNQPNSGHSLPDNETDVSVHVDHANLIKTALQVPPSNPQNLERARELFLSGELDSPANILKAAENLYNYGI